MALPGRAKQPNIKQKTGKQPPASDQEKEGAVEEFTFEQMKDMGKDLKDLREGASREQLKEIREKKAQEELEEKKKKKKKKKKDDKIDLKDITTELEAKKGGLPEHIAKLPENHPIRVRWEKGFRQREDGTWYKTSDLDYQDGIRISEDMQRAFLIVPLIVLGIAIVIGGNWYANQLTETRDKIIKTVKSKGLSTNNPKTKEKLKKAYRSHWLPELTSLLDEIKKTKRSFAGFGDNAESGSYMQHIKKHNKKFDAQEAMQWRTRIIRKPSQ
jgi:hypothetical protein